MIKCASRDKTAPGGFQFKQFFVADSECAMKVGTDGILLGAWVLLPGNGELLDIGCGSGLIALMLAQRSQGALGITGVELDDRASAQARDNAQASPWSSSLHIIHRDIDTFQASRPFAHIVSNPPYFQHGQIFEDHRRAQARHTGTLDYPALLHHAARLLDKGGQLSVILPYQQGLDFIAMAQDEHWHCRRLCRVKTTPRKAYHRLMLTLSRDNGPQQSDTLVIHDGNGGYSEAYVRLTRDFYLKM